jgi:hypothetical protein
MPATTTINDRTVVHKKSDGIAFAFADPCLTPPAPTAVPYVNFAVSKDASGTSVSVFVDGEGIMLRASCFATSYGDDPGTVGGLLSGVNKGKAVFVNYAFDVKVEGQEVPRQYDPMTQNVGTMLNAMTPAEMQPTITVDMARTLICAAVCACILMDIRHGWCVEHQLAEKKRGPAGMFWDPYWPQIWVEPSYYLDPSLVWVPGGNVDRYGRPAGSLRNFPGIKRPDIVVTKNPNLPPHPGNIAKIFDIKMGLDHWRPGQRDAYERIAGGPVEEVSPKTCGCPFSPREIFELTAFLAFFLKMLADGLKKAGGVPGRTVAGFPGIFPSAEWWQRLKRVAMAEGEDA